MVRSLADTLLSIKWKTPRSQNRDLGHPVYNGLVCAIGELYEFYLK